MESRKRAEQAVYNLDNSKDKYVVYRESRPVWNLKQMLQSSVELYGNNTAFMQKFKKDGQYEHITYREALAAVTSWMRKSMQKP